MPHFNIVIFYALSYIKFTHYVLHRFRKSGIKGLKLLNLTEATVKDIKIKVGFDFSPA